MPRWLWWTPFGLLILGFALIGLRSGWMAARMTETDVINHYAADYVANGPAGAALSDCVAVPGAVAPIWIVIRCGQGEMMRQYPVDRQGRLVVIAPNEEPEA